MDHGDGGITRLILGFPELGLLTLGLALLACGAQADPSVTNIRASQRAGTKLVDVYYDVSAGTSQVAVSVQVSTNSGASYTLPASSFAGDVGIDGTWSAELDPGLALPQWDMLGFKVAPSVHGGIEGEFRPGGWAIGGFGGFEVEADYTSPAFYFWAVPPIYGQWAVELEQAVEGHIGYDSADGLYLNGEFPGEAQLEGIAGVGIDWVTDVEVFVGGGPFWKFQWPTEPTLADWGVKLHGGVRWLILGYQDEVSVERSWSGMTEGSSPTPMALAVGAAAKRPPLSAFSLMPRDYLRTAGARTMAASALGAGVALSGIVSGDVVAVAENCFPYAQPSLAAKGANQFLLWLVDDPARTAENRTKLVCATWVGGAWSNAAPVWDEGTADFAPAAGALADGSALAVWQNQRALLPDGAGLEEALAGCEIAAGRLDPGTGLWSASNLTDNAYLDHSPKLSVSADGSALLTWISNTGNDPLGSSTTQNVVRACLWNGSNWVGATDVVVGAPMMLWSTAAYDGTNGVFLATIDRDDDESTVEDQEIYGASFGGSGWGSFVQLTTNVVQDTKPQAVYDAAGRLLVAWAQGSNIVMRAGNLDLGSPAVVGHTEGTSSAKDFRLVTGPNGEISIVWEDLASDGSGPDPLIFNYDPVFGTWSQALRLLNNTNQLERSFSGAYASDGELLLAYNRVAVSVNSSNVPSLGQVDLMFMGYLVGGDLAAQDGDITISAANPTNGQTVNVSAVVRNLGEIAATNVAVAFYDGNPGAGGVVIGSSQMVSGLLPAGSNATVEVAWTVPAAVSNRLVFVVVDPNMLQEDRNRANNTAGRVLLGADLNVDGMTVTRPSPEARMINAKAANEGSTPCGAAADVVFRRGATNGTVLATVSAGDLPAGGVFDAGFEWDMSGVTFTGAFERVYATVDPANAIAEADESNNLGMVQVVTTLDTDGDTLFDGDELHYGTNPQIQDTDGDGLTDGEEVHTYRTDPTVADSDSDRIPDGWEVENRLDALNDADAPLDFDRDGRTNYQEWLGGSDPWNANSFFETASFTVAPKPDGTGSIATVSWASAAGRLYRVERSFDLKQWDPVADNIAPTPPLNTLNDEIVPIRARVFYRILAK